MIDFAGATDRKTVTKSDLAKMAPRILFSKLEREILAHRLGVSDALADCLTDTEEPVAFTWDQVAARAEELRRIFEPGLFCGDYDLLSATPLDREILADCVNGSTWNLANETESEVSLGNVSRGQVLAWHKAQRSIEAKMARVGLRVRFPLE